MFSSNPFQKFIQGPKSGLKLAEDIKTKIEPSSLLNHAKKILTDRIPKPHLPNIPTPHLPNIPTPHLPNIKIPHLPNIPIPHLPKIPGLPNIPIPDLSNIKIPGLPNIPIPDLSNIKIPGLPNIKIPHLPNLNLLSDLPNLNLLSHLPNLKLLSHLPNLKSLSHLLKIFNFIPNHLKLILMIICGAIIGVIVLLLIVAVIAGCIAAPGYVLPVVGVLIITGGVGLIILVVLVIIWYFFCNDRDVSLGVLEYFGKGTRKYSGKVVWIVGASTSLGQAMALELASAGAKIVLSSRRPHIMKKLKSDCIEISKGKLSDTDILILPFAVTEMDEKYVDDVIEHFGKIDVVIDNISHIELGEAIKTSIGMEKAILDVNFFGPVFLIKQVVNHFKETDGGQVIVVSSISGKFGIPGQAASSASKQALNMYFECLRYECTGHKIYITTVCPGLILSSVTDNSVLVGKALISQEEQLKMTRKGIKTSRCAHLVLVAGANRCTESWVSNQPFLFLIYLAQYFPWIHRLIMRFLFSEKNLEKIYEGKSPSLWMWRPPLFVL